jgi:hypothetical protein
MTFKELTDLEPRLIDLLNEAKSISSKENPNFCTNRIWYGYQDSESGLKYRMSRLVGNFTESDNSILRSSAAYDLAYRTIYDALPDCSHQGGFC